MRPARDDLHVLTGSYVLDALGESERESFERHLARCGSCAAEVRGLRETAARLAMARAMRPPPHLQARVLAAAHRTRQLPPSPAARPGRARSRVPAGLARRAPRGPSVRWPRLLLATAAASVAATLAMGVTQVITRHQLEGARAALGASAALTRVEQAPDARAQTVRASVGGTVTVVVSLRLKQAVVTATGMPPASSARVYQVWVIGPGGAHPAGFVTTGPVLASGIGPGDRIGITVEPAGGTSRPTTNPVVLVPV